MNHNEWHDLVKGALNDLIEHDYYLLASSAHERSLTHKLGEHLQKRTSYDVDCEYNRQAYNPKMLNGKLILPDIIVHKRGTNENIVEIEAKRRANNRTAAAKKDIERLKKLTDSSSGYGYKVAYFIDFNHRGNVSYCSTVPQLVDGSSRVYCIEVGPYESNK